MTKENKKDLIIELTIIFSILTAKVLWALAQYEFAGLNIYMFKPTGQHIAYGHIEGYQGYFPFALPPFFANACLICFAMSMVKAFFKIKKWLYVACAALSLASIIMYILTYFNISHRFGNIVWRAPFWIAIFLHSITFIFLAYYAFADFRKSKRVSAV